METIRSIDTPQPGMGNVKLALAVLSEPRAAFAELRQRPDFWFPLLLFVVMTVCAVVAYFQRVDMAWLNDHLAGSAPRLPKGSAEVPAMSREMMMWTSVTMMVIGIPIMRMVEGACYLLAGKVANLALGFRHWLALACWSSLPLLLPLLAAVVQLMLHPSGQVTQEQLNVLSLNELFFHVAPASPWFTLANALTLLHPWAWGLVAVAVRTWTGRGWGHCVGFALLPWIVFYGLWALFAAL